MRDLRHVRWLVGLLERGDDGRLAIPATALPKVELAVQSGLDDPKLAVRRKAELRAQQRMDRMAARAWPRVRCLAI